MAPPPRLLLSMVAGLSLWPLSAHAQSRPEPPISFMWDAPANCPRAATVVAESMRLLGGSPSGKSPVRASATVRRTDGGWRLRLVTRIDGKAGERQLRGASCAEIADATSLILALSYDPEGIVAEPAPRPSAEPPPPSPVPSPTAPADNPEPAAPPTPDTAPVPPSPSPSPPADDDGEALLGGSLAGLVSADLGALPNVTLGFGGAAGLRIGLLRLELSGSYWLGQSRTLPGTSAGGSFTFASGALQGGPWWQLGRFGLGPQVGIELGRMTARGFGVARIDEASLLWSAARLGGTASVVLIAPVSWRLDLGASIPFDRPRWVLDEVGEVDRPGAVTARGSTGVEVRF